jgi:hypothetical protein
MRGGAQAQLLEADDGNWYVVKFRNNPQHHRVLVNELLAAAFLEYLKVAVPETAIIQVTAPFLAAHPEIHLQVGTNRIAVEPGWHFGSRYPGDPARATVYDFLPDSLLSRVVNLEDFRAILVFDKWVGNADGRQSVFYRALVKHGTAIEGRVSAPSYHGFVARMIDNGAGAVCAARGLSSGSVAGRFPAVAPPDHAFSRGGGRPRLEAHSRRLDRRRRGCPGAFAGEGLPAPAAIAGTDQCLPDSPDEPVSKLAVMSPATFAAVAGASRIPFR